MDKAALEQLVENAALLLALVLLFDVTASRWQVGRVRWQQILVGLVIGASGIGVMLMPWTFAPGIIFDTRSVLLSVSGLFFGALPTLIAMAMTAAFRLAQGGAGALTGVSVIVATGTLGIAWRHLRRRPLTATTWRELWGFGLIVHLVMLVLMFTLPRDAVRAVLSAISLPVLVLYPLATVLMGLLMVNRLRRIQAEEDVRASEGRLRGYLDHAPHGVLVTDLTGTILEVNPTTCQLSGYSEKELLGMNILDLLMPEARAAGMQSLYQVVHTGQTRGEFAFRHKDGAMGWAAIAAVRLADDRLLGFTEDITARRETEDALRRRNEYLAALQETTLELVSQLDLDTLLENIVRRAAQLAGTTAGALDLVDLANDRLVPRVGIGAMAESLKHAARRGEGIVGTVWQTGRPLVVDDYDNWLGRISGFPRGILRAVIGVPLQSGEQIIGVLGLAHEQADGRIFDRETVEMLMQFARLATIAIENARAFAAVERSRRELLSILEGQKRSQQALEESHRQLERRAGELAVIYESARRLQRLQAPDALAQEIIKILEETLGYEYGSILLIDEKSSELQPFALSDQGRGPAFIAQDKAYIASHHITVGRGITGYVAQTGQTVRLGDVRSDPRYYAVREGICSELCVPLRVGERIIGVLNVESSRPDAYTESDQRVLETIASQIALAIEQAQLHEQVRRHADELEQRVRERTAQLQRLNQELEAFAYAVSHDLRAPLRALDGFSAALLARHGDRLDAQGRHYLERIQGASQRMSQMIEALLGLSRVARSELIRKPVDLTALAQEIVAELRQRDPQRQAEFIIEESLKTVGDARLLRLALENLLENAWKFTAGRPIARIEVGRLTDGDVQPAGLPDAAPAARADSKAQGTAANTQTFFVRDNGVGFDMAYADKLFGPFQRLHPVEEFPGTGIGLVTVQRIIARHGGRVWAEAAVDRGATFYFEIADLDFQV